ncbi:high-affinity hexose transporter HXT6 [Bombardia bombarda]|uniref:High-affinity hexose transporter HXT6 n=1 Tax=Bombardia bombarda TaxID=252184 RepID=A0AA39XMK6_9PEZI|nr:high-affinity hexose transporter HXT6 [Bombardia bombarda]
MDEVPSFMNRRVVCMGITYSLGGFLYGYDTGRYLSMPISPRPVRRVTRVAGQISGFLEMENFKQAFGTFDDVTGKYFFSSTRSGLIVGLLSIGNLLGALVAGPVADRLGRKLPTAIACLVYMVGVIVQISSRDHWYQVALGRWTGGLGVGALSILVPLATSETSPTNARGLVVSGYQMAVTMGICLASLVNLGTETIQSSASWRITIGLDFLWVGALLLGLLFVPESPKYLFGIGQRDKARTIMAGLMRVQENHPILLREMNEMEDRLRVEQMHKSVPWWHAFRSREVIVRTLLATGILSFQQLTGANFFFYYGTTIFAATGISNSYITQVILGVVNVVCTVPGLYFAQKLSRKRCLVFGALWMAIWFIIYASAGQFWLDQETPSNTPGASALLIAATALFIAGFASTWGPISWGEATLVCPAHTRATSASMATAVYWMWSFLLAFFTPAITARIHYFYGYVFSGCCLAMALMVQLFVIDSQGRTLEEIDSLYSKRLQTKSSDDEKSS